MSLTDSLGTFAGDLTQHSLVLLHFVALMSPLRHHPLILLPQQSSLVSLFRVSNWWKSTPRSPCVACVAGKFKAAHVLNREWLRRMWVVPPTLRARRAEFRAWDKQKQEPPTAAPEELQLKRAALQ